MRPWFFAAVLAVCCLPALSPRVDLAIDQKYKPLVDALHKWLPEEIAAKGIPALSWALVDDQQVICAEGCGFEDPVQKTTATGDTVYRVGSLSKPITALLLMMLAERGQIDLDAPVQTYLLDFRPKNSTGKAITLRQMLTHRSGLVREPPVGNCFDASEPTLAQTVASLNQTELVFAPETTISYSNAALAAVGLVMEKTQGRPFATLMHERLLDPIGMASSSYAPTKPSQQKLARGLMWTYHGKRFDAPTWELAMSPAGGLRSTVKDQAKLLSFLFAGGRTAGGQQLLKRETLEAMYKIQYGKPGDKVGFGLSFMVSEVDGKRRIGHDGAIYGFATHFSALPDENLGVVVIASKDVANAVTSRIGTYALRAMLALRQGQTLPAIQKSTPLLDGAARALAGRYRGRDKEVELMENAGRLYVMPVQGGVRTELRRIGADLVADDVTGYGLRIARDGDKLKIGADTFERVPPPSPLPLLEKWQGLIGEYGPDYNILYILEKDGKLHALIEWVMLYPLEEVTPDVYKFPAFGLYMGEKIKFKRDKNGRAVEAEAANVLFTRRNLKGENATYKIQPVRPVAELRTLALQAKPPAETGPFFKKAELVDVTPLDNSVKLEIRYATDNNFLGTPLYTSARAFLQRPAAQALIRAHRKLKEQGFGLLIHDAYRPWYVTKVFYDATPPQFHHFVADPQQGSRHNRGCAIDLTLYHLKTGKAVDMVSGYDEFSDRAYPDYLGGTSLQRFHRALLRRAMEDEGFTVYEAEWWHFDYRAWRRYRIMNERFEDLRN
jgi:CubicO group peptidase (beta-lactamase class C family)/D-alanyl-D-alanine dipeptidase